MALALATSAAAETRPASAGRVAPAPAATDPARPAARIKRPRPLEPEACQPHYPADARDEGVGGRLVARYVITTEGTTRDVEFAEGGDPRLEAAVRQALARCRFEPASQGGRPIAVMHVQTFRFRPDEPPPEGEGDTSKANRGEVVEEAASASPGPPRVVVVSALPKEAIQQVVSAHSGEIVSCYETALETEPTLAGRVTSRFTIGADGRVAAAEVAESTLEHEGVEQCILSRVRGWGFPEPRGGGVVHVTYPWIFKPDPERRTLPPRRRIVVRLPAVSASPDRPRRTLTARTTAKGAVELEAGGDLDGAAVALQYGVGTAADVSLGIGWDADPGTARPLAVGLRWRLVEQWGPLPALAVMGEGRLAPGELTWKLGASAAAIASWRLPVGALIDVNGGLASLPGGPMRPWAAAAVRTSPAPRGGAFAEVALAWPTEGATRVDVAAGVRLALSRRFFLDAAVRRHLDAEAWGATAGITWLVAE